MELGIIISGIGINSVPIGINIAPIGINPDKIDPATLQFWDSGRIT
ncbi:hypothetical protein [Bacillus sp. FJAT-27245]|nr:hypothetical protein [Bacillus sp. FJAT-27245]